MFILLIVTIFVQGSSGNIRQDFNENKASEKGLKSIINSSLYADNSITKAYKGLAETMLAEYSYMPTSKLAHFNDGKKLIEKAVTMNSSNAEVRYARLMVQLNAPSFLDYNENVQEDLNVFVKRLKTDVIEKKWQSIFINNLLACKYIEQAHKNKLKTVQ